jgi:hypothetical protein
VQSRRRAVNHLLGGPGCACRRLPSFGQRRWSMAPQRASGQTGRSPARRSRRNAEPANRSRSGCAGANRTKGTKAVKRVRAGRGRVHPRGPERDPGSPRALPGGVLVEPPGGEGSPLRLTPFSTCLRTMPHPLLYRSASRTAERCSWASLRRAQSTASKTTVPTTTRSIISARVAPVGVVRSTSRDASRSAARA